MDHGERAHEVVELIAAVAETLRADKPAGDVICQSLLRATGGDAAVWIAVQPNMRPLEIGSHPSPEAAERLLNALQQDGLPEETSEPLVRQLSGLGQVMVLAPAPLPGAAPTDTRRIVALSRRRGFTAEDISFGAEVLPALRLMLSQVVSTSERWLHAQIRRQSAREFGLTERELEVLQLLSHGLLATSMAARLDLSPRTIHKHLGNIYEKMGVHDRLVAVSMARERGLVDAA